MRTLSVHGHVQVADETVGAEDLAQVVFVDVFGQLLDHNLCILSAFWSISKRVFQNQIKNKIKGTRPPEANGTQRCVSPGYKHKLKRKGNHIPSATTHLRALRWRTSSTPTPTPGHAPISIPPSASATAPAP